jgi:hypothetical protein
MTRLSRVAETCSGCGAIRFSWMGGSHWHRKWPNRNEDRRVCDGQLADDYWQYFFAASSSGWWVA